MTFPSIAQTGIGIVAPYDMALDREMWRWAPEDVSLHFTRTPYSPLEVTLEMAQLVSETEMVTRSAKDLSAVSPDVYVYACTSGSFVRGLAGELEIVAAMQEVSDAKGVTTSGALLAALTALGIDSVAIATPYDEEVTGRLAAFLNEGGIYVGGYANLGLHTDIWKVPYDVSADLIRQADTPAAEAVIVSCTNLPTYDLIAPLEAELGKPVLTANQATMWAALRLIGRHAHGPGQRLLVEPALGVV